MVNKCKTQRHKTFKAATRAIKGTIKKGAINNLSVYLCEKCNHYHIGSGKRDRSVWKKIKEMRSRE